MTEVLKVDTASIRVLITLLATLAPPPPLLPAPTRNFTATADAEDSLPAFDQDLRGLVAAFVFQLQQANFFFFVYPIKLILTVFSFLASSFLFGISLFLFPFT